MLGKYFEKIKELYTNLAASSNNYPHVGWLEFASFCRAAEVVDSSLPTSTVDQLFWAAKVGSVHPAIQTTLFRHEFFDVLVRVAIAKYRDTNLVPTLGEALEKLLKAMLAKFNPRQEWHAFRTNQLWDDHIDRLYQANLHHLQRIYGYLFPKHENLDGLRNCIEVVTRLSRLNLYQSSVRLCYALSKMTVVDEPTDRKEYNRLQFVEFLEFIARLAALKYADHIFI